MADIIAYRRVRRRRQQLLQRSQWMLRDRMNPFNLDETKFIKMFRLSKAAAMHLFEELRPHFRLIHGGYSLEMQVLCCLYFLGTGNFQHVSSTADFAQISQTSVSRYLQKFVDAVSNILPTYINFPVSNSELAELKAQFFVENGFPNCIGAIDCSHIQITKPVENDYFVFLNRHMKFSINVQMVCDNNMKIMDVVARWPGSNHDSFIWRCSSLRDLFVQNHIPEKNFLVGDSGYPLEPWLMTPYATESLERQKKFNKIHRKTRNVIERCFGVLKSRFRCLHETGGALQYAPEKVCKIVIACAVLHNICLMFNVPTDTDDTDVYNTDFGTDNEPDDGSSETLRQKALRFRDQISIYM